MSDETKAATVLVVDDDEGMRHFAKRALARRGYVVHAAASAEDALVVLGSEPVDVVVSDVRMPGMTGIELLEKLPEVSAGTRAVLMTAFGTIDQAVAALHEGAESYLTKPFETDELVAVVARAAEKARLDTENRALREMLRERDAYAGLVGASKPMRRLYRRIERIARQSGLVLIQGESGTGKELVARALHQRGRVPDGPFVAVPCGALPPTLASVELFGAEQGAFTGAERSRRGYLERADGGTVYLDGVDELPLEAQPGLLRFLETREVQRVGGPEPVSVAVRVVASTREDLRSLVASGRLKEDLFYRLHVLTIDVPPLRKRAEDVPLLVAHVLERLGHADVTFDPELLSRLESLPYPGNVRELANLVERLVHLSPGAVVGVDALPAEFSGQPKAAPGRDLVPYRQALASFERDYLVKLLRRTGGNVSEAARLGGISRPSLHGRITALGIDRNALPDLP